MPISPDPYDPMNNNSPTMRAVQNDVANRYLSVTRRSDEQDITVPH